MKNRILLCFLSLVVFVVYGCNNKQMICDTLDSCEHVIEGGMTIRATNDFGTLIITADGDEHRTIKIDGITTDDKYIKFPVGVRENWGNPPSPVIGYKGRIGKLWDEEREVFIKNIDYLETTRDFSTVESANDYLNRLYNDWKALQSTRNYNVRFEYAWSQNGIVVYWAIDRPEYWTFPSSYYIYLIVDKIYVNGEVTQDLIKCPHLRSSIEISNGVDE